MQPPDLGDHYRAMARYNRSMNERLYALCANVEDTDRKRDQGAFFGSIHGTLNHLLLTDRVQLGRFLGADASAALSRDADGTELTARALDHQLHADFAQLRRERVRTDAAISAWVGTLTTARLAAPLRYRAMVDGREYEHPLWWAVSHFFNHQTHHRGQVTTLLSRLGRDVGSTDLMTMLRAEPG